MRVEILEAVEDEVVFSSAAPGALAGDEDMDVSTGVIVQEVHDVDFGPDVLEVTPDGAAIDEDFQP